MTLPNILRHLRADDRDRLFLADAIAAAEADAAADEREDDDPSEVTWDEILVTAIDSLLTTPAGRGPRS